MRVPVSGAPRRANPSSVSARLSNWVPAQSDRYRRPPAGPQRHRQGLAGPLPPTRPVRRTLGGQPLGGIQFAFIVRCQLLESFTVGVGIHGLREPPRAGDLLEQKRLIPGHGVTLIRCSVPRTNTRRGNLLQERQFEGLQPPNVQASPLLGFLISSPTIGWRARSLHDLVNLAPKRKICAARDRLVISTDRPPTSEQWRRAAGHPRSGGTRNALVRRSHCGQASSASRRAGKASGSDAASTFGFLISLVPGEVRTQALPQFSRCRRQPSASLVSRPGQSVLQLLLLLVPTGFLRLRSLFDRGAVGLDGGRTLVALLLGLFKCGLRLVDRLLAPLTLLFVCWLFLPTAGLLSLSKASAACRPALSSRFRGAASACFGSSSTCDCRHQAGPWAVRRLP